MRFICVFAYLCVSSMIDPALLSPFSINWFEFNCDINIFRNKLCIWIILALTIIRSRTGRDLLLFSIFYVFSFMVILMEAIPLRSLPDKQQLFSVTQNSLFLIQNGPLHVCYTFRPVLRASSCMSTKTLQRIVGFLFGHGCGWPKYRSKHVAYVWRRILN